MKKILLTVFILMIGVLFVGCNKEEKKDTWKINLDVEVQALDSDVKKVFEDAKKNYNKNIDYVALLGTQVVAGTNYMFLCKDETGFKVAIIYRNLEGTSQITNVVEFNPSKYINEKSSYTPEQLAGGWYTRIPEKMVTIDPTVEEYFDEASKELTGIDYYPIGVLAKKDKPSSSYAILCYGRGTYQEAIPGIYMINLIVDEKKGSEIVSITSINLADFNK